VPLERPGRAGQAAWDAPRFRGGCVMGSEGRDRQYVPERIQLDRTRPALCHTPATPGGEAGSRCGLPTRPSGWHVTAWSRVQRCAAPAVRRALTWRATPRHTAARPGRRPRCPLGHRRPSGRSTKGSLRGTSAAAMVQAARELCDDGDVRSRPLQRPVTSLPARRFAVRPARSCQDRRRPPPARASVARQASGCRDRHRPPPLRGRDGAGTAAGAP
jgi:hypothetical protein